MVRHGQSAGNVARDAAEANGLHGIDIATRDIDVPLSELGRRQSQSLGHWFGSLPLRFDQPVLLTPHAGETAHLSVQSKDDVKADAPALARDMALKHNAVIALKGASTFIIPPEGESWCHVSANAGMGTSGSGDVLAGIITGLAARGAPLVQAAAWGVVVHALAGATAGRAPWPAGFSGAGNPEGNPVCHVSMKLPTGGKVKRPGPMKNRAFKNVSIPYA